MASTDNAGYYYNPGWYRAGRAVWTLVFKRYLQVRLTGEQYMPDCGPAVLAANHVSNLDPFLMGCVLPSAHPVAFMAKQELFAFRPLAFLMRSWGGFPVDRSKKDATALRTALSVLRAGEILGMFPEGTRGTTDSDGGVADGRGAPGATGGRAADSRGHRGHEQGAAAGQ